MRITVDTTRCVASGQCVLIAPELFDQRADDGKVVLLDESPELGQQDGARESALVCPSGAIRLTEA